MKKVLIFTNILFLGVAVFFGLNSCNDSGKNEENAKVDTAKCTTCMAYNDVGNASQLDKNLVEAMTYYYQTDPTVTGTNFKKTRSVWISLEKLKQFIYQVESKTCDCKGGLGVRVYFAKYPPDADWISPNGFRGDLNNPQKDNFRAGLLSRYVTSQNPYDQINTIVMVPTIEQGGKNFDFDPADAANGCKGGYSTKYRTGSEKDSMNYILHNAFGSSITALSATNHGDACPPPIPGCKPEGAAFDH